MLRLVRAARKRFSVALRRRREPHVLVLLYHRIAAADTPDPWGLCVGQSRFREHLEVLQRMATVIPLRHVGDLRNRDRGKRVVALSFDDGYLDNLHAALPLLERFGAPATFFVPTACIGREAPFWWDELAADVLSPEPLPRAIELSQGGFRWRWSAAEESYRGSEPRARRRLLDSLYSRLLTLEETTRDRVLEALANALGRPRPRPRGCRPMNADELRTLGASPLVEVGAHTETHCHLASVSHEKQAAEIEGSFATIGELLGKRPESFAYPYGAFDARSVDLVRRAGFARACTSEPGLAWHTGDVCKLPRVVVRDWDGATFARRLRREWLP
jgi:peptidoglycan/xylan/chitin deacetylase (PgdA/CDA1 family)